MPAAAKSPDDMIDITPRPSRGGGVLRIAGLLLGAVVFTAGGFAAGWFHFSRAQSPVAEALRLIERGETAEADTTDGSEPQRVARPIPEAESFVTSYYTFEEPLTTNPAGSRRFLQVGITISTQYDAMVMTNVETHKAAIRSDMLAVVGSMSEEQIAGREGREALAMALRDAINERLLQFEGFGGVEGVFFTSFVLQ
jgi:flagellar FliL protein